MATTPIGDVGSLHNDLVLLLLKEAIRHGSVRAMRRIRESHSWVVTTELWKCNSVKGCISGRVVHPFAYVNYKNTALRHSMSNGKHMRVQRFTNPTRNAVLSKTQWFQKTCTIEEPTTLRTRAKKRFKAHGCWFLKVHETDDATVYRLRPPTHPTTNAQHDECACAPHDGTSCCDSCSCNDGDADIETKNCFFAEDGYVSFRRWYMCHALRQSTQVTRVWAPKAPQQFATQYTQFTTSDSVFIDCTNGSRQMPRLLPCYGTSFFECSVPVPTMLAVMHPM
jgi:hypothetical protein